MSVFARGFVTGFLLSVPAARAGACVDDELQAAADGLDQVAQFGCAYIASTVCPHGAAEAVQPGADVCATDAARYCAFSCFLAGSPQCCDEPPPTSQFAKTLYLDSVSATFQ